MKLTTRKLVITVVVDQDEVDQKSLLALTRDLESRARDHVGVYEAEADTITHSARVIEAPDMPTDGTIDEQETWERTYVRPLL